MMKRRRWKSASAWALLGAALILPGCSPLDDQAPDPGTTLVSIRDNFFQPDTVTIAQGAVVRWTNEGARYHRVIINGGQYQSNLLPLTWWFEVRFDSAGTYDYECLADSTHTETGTVLVQ